MKEQILMDLGLSQNESKIYLSLLETGFSNPTKIAEASGVHRVNVYDSVNKLKEKGLISEVVKEGKRCFQAAPPESLKNILREKEMQLNKIIPELELQKKLAEHQHQVEMYEGHDFIRNMFIRFLEKKEDILDLGIPKFVLEQMSKQGMDGEYFHNELHKRRIKQKQTMYHIYNSDAKDRIKFLNTLPYTKARYLPSDFNQVVTTTICGDELVIQVYHEDGQKPQSIVIKNENIANAYKKYFWLIWDKAETP